MSVDRAIVADRETTKATRAQPRVQAPEPAVYRRNYPVEQGPLDWEDAVTAATVLLNASFGLRASADNPIVADMARELAARLCAYNVTAGATEDMPRYVHAPVAND
jgi:hypothetical protein